MNDNELDTLGASLMAQARQNRKPPAKRRWVDVHEVACRRLVNALDKLAERLGKTPHELAWRSMRIGQSWARWRDRKVRETA